MGEVVEDRLRRALHEQEHRGVPAHDLADAAIRSGRRAVRRRRVGLVVGSAVLTVASAVGAVGVVVGGPADDPAVRPTGPALPEPDDGVPMSAWLAALPQGALPEVPYVVGSTLHAGGRATRLGGQDAAVVGWGPLGTVVLVEHDVEGEPFRSEYLLVTPDGAAAVVADGRTRGVQDAEVSPDGRLFARAGEVVDLADGTVVASIPDDAVVVTGWVEQGLVYDDREGATYVWEPGAEPRRLDESTWFPNVTGVGLVRGGDCPTVLDIATAVARTTCGPSSAVTVSPDGRWLLDERLRVVDSDTGESRALAGSPDAPRAWVATRWVSDSTVLLGTTYGVARCDAATGTCERALDGPADLP